MASAFLMDRKQHSCKPLRRLTLSQHLLASLSEASLCFHPGVYKELQFDRRDSSAVWLRGWPPPYYIGYPSPHPSLYLHFTLVPLYLQIISSLALCASLHTQLCIPPHHFTLHSFATLVYPLLPLLEVEAKVGRSLPSYVTHRGLCNT